MAGLRHWNVVLGQFFFRYRNTIFPVIFLLLALTTKPKVILNHATLDRVLVICGAFIAFGGELFRLVTIGYDYIDRGGKDGQAYASRLVQKGMYTHTRNPMYFGNILIAIGVSMVCGSSLAYLIVIPFFLFVYHAIASSEEAYLQRRFGQEYDEYCRRVPRFIPSLRGAYQLFAKTRYNWKRALRQDLSTIVGLLMGLTLIPLWRAYFLQGFAAAKALVLRTLILSLAVLSFYVLVHSLKKRGRLQ